MPSVASQVSASHQLHAHQSNARSRTDSSDRGQNSPFSELLDSTAPAPEPPPAPRHARADRSDAPPRPADKSRKTDSREDRNTSDKTKDASDVQDGARAKDVKDTKNTDNTTAKDAKAGDDAAKPADDGTTTAATETETKPDADPAAALQAMLVDPAQPVVTTAATVIAAPQPVASDAPAADATAASGAATQIDALIALQAAKQTATADEGKPAAKDKKEDKTDAKGDTKGDAKALTQTKSDITADTKATAAQPGQDGDTEQQNGGKQAHDIRHSAAKPAGENAEAETRGHHAAETKAGAAPAGATITTASADAAAAATAAAPSANAPQVQPQTLAPAHIQAQLQAQAQTQANAAAAIPLSGVAVEIATQASAGKQHFEIRLDPAELGRIDVKLDIDSDGNTTTRLVVERTETLELLKRDASQLERALQQAGLKTSDNAMEFTLRQQFAQSDDQGPSNTTKIVVPDDEATRLPVQRQGYGRLLGMSGGLDIRV